MLASLGPSNIMMIAGLLVLAAVVATAIINPVLTVIAAVVLTAVWLILMVVLTWKQ